MKKLIPITALTLLLVTLLSSLPAVASTMVSQNIQPTIKLIPSSTEVKDITVSADGTIFAASGSSSLYESTNLGKKWTTITCPADVDLLAVAPDNRDNIVFVDTATNIVYVTNNGGLNWGSIGIPQQDGQGAANFIGDIAISVAVAGIRYIIIAGAETGPYANVWYFNFGAVLPSWTETNSLPGFQATSVNSKAGAIAVSPNFVSDRIILAITEQDDGTDGSNMVNVWLEVFDFVSQVWNPSSSFAGYPVTIASDTGITNLFAASVSLDPGYLASDESTRLVFVGLSLAGATDKNGVYRAWDTATTGLKTGIDVNVYSVGFNGTNIVAGAYGTNTVYYSSDPTASDPTISSSSKPPSGMGMVVVALVGDLVVAGTSGNNGSLAISKNNGETFRRINIR